MAKKKTEKNKKKLEQSMLESVLPQNILAIGEKSEDDKKVYISQKTYKTIHKFARNKTSVESGGMLLGKVLEEFGKTNIIIDGFVEAKYSEATPTTLKFTHETWDYVHKEIAKKHSGKKILGWIHTHPDFGIFLSEYDKFIHQNFFSEENQVAYVVDPIQDIEGFYFWINGSLKKAEGFYIYDKTGVKIDIEIEYETTDQEVTKKSVVHHQSDFFSKLVMAFLVIAVLYLGYSNFTLVKKVNDLKAGFELVNQVSYQNIGYLQQQITTLSQELNTLKENQLNTTPEENQNEAENNQESNLGNNQENGIENGQ